MGPEIKKGTTEIALPNYLERTISIVPSTYRSYVLHDKATHTNFCGPFFKSFIDKRSTKLYLFFLLFYASLVARLYWKLQIARRADYVLRCKLKKSIKGHQQHPSPLICQYLLNALPNPYINTEKPLLCYRRNDRPRRKMIAGCLESARFCI